MTDNNQVGDPEKVNEELPSPKFTASSGDSATSDSRKDDLEERLAKRLEATVEKAVKSYSDKRFSKLDTLEREAGGYDNLIKALKKRGVDVPDEVLEAVREKEEIQELRRRVDGMTSPQSSGKVGAEKDIWKQVIDETGLTDSVQIALLAQRAAKGEFRDENHLIREAHRIVKSPSPPVSQAEDAPRPTKPSGTPSPEALLAEYHKEMAAIPRGTRGQSAREAVKEKYRKGGLDVDKVFLPV